MKIGDDYPVWWFTGRKVSEGTNLATIIGIRPYVGKFSEDFTHILKLTAPSTERGWMEMSV